MYVRERFLPRELLVDFSPQGVIIHACLLTTGVSGAYIRSNIRLTHAGT
jgi:hypothetical protein